MSKRSHFGRRVRELREAAGWSQYRLAREAGLTNQGVTNIEDGTTANPSWRTACALADALGVDVGAFRAEKESRTK